MVTRRAFLKAGGLALFTMTVGGSPLFLGRTVRAIAAPGPYGKRRVLVAIFQRGAMDGLMAVPPFTDPMLVQMRPRLSMTAAQAANDAALIDLDEHFGLHPALEPFFPLYKEGRLAIVHGVGSPDPTRSHFDAQDYMETGTPGRKGTPNGWLNRAVGLLGHERTPFCACAMTSTLPRSLHGDEQSLAIADLRDFGVHLPNRPLVAQSAQQSFQLLYGQTSQQLLRGTGREGFEAVKILSQTELRTFGPANGVEYPKSPLGASMRQIAQLIKADVGLEIAFAETGGWDTHVQQGTVNGTFAQRARDLADSIVAFWTDIEQYHDDVALITMTEFGRTVHENGSGGTDHGRASCMFVLGNRVDGGKVHGKVPPLVPEELEEGRDIPVTTDFRSLFAAVAGNHLGITDDQKMFPGWNGSRLHIMKV